MLATGYPADALSPTSVVNPAVGAQLSNYPFPTVYQGNLSIERELFAGVVASVSYVGNSTVHLNGQIDVNAPTPGAGARNAAGWEMCLELLDRVVAGSRQGSASDAGMEEFLPVLEKYKAKGVPDDGWLPDPPQR